jgi:hypothetical protein
MKLLNYFIMISGNVNDEEVVSAGYVSILWFKDKQKSHQGNPDGPLTNKTHFYLTALSAMCDP